MFIVLLSRAAAGNASKHILKKVNYFKLRPKCNQTKLTTTQMHNKNLGKAVKKSMKIAQSEKSESK